MKVTELQIGDCVMSNKRDKNKIVKVVSIDSGTKCCWLDADYFSGIVACEDIEPIYLTAEILKINGWKRDFDKEWKYNNSHILPNYIYQWKKDNIKIEMEANCKGFTIDNIIGYRFYAVHELQHVLRLCGLNDLADNFKV